MRSCAPSISTAGSPASRSPSESAPLFERPSINLGRIQGGDAVNKVPDIVPYGGRCALPAGAVAGRGAAPGPLARPDGPLEAAAGAAAGRRLARQRVRAGPARGREPPRALGHLGRARRRLRRGRLPRGRRARPSSSAPAAQDTTGREEYVEIESLPLYRRALAEFARRVAALPAPAVDPEVAASDAARAAPPARPLLARAASPARLALRGRLDAVGSRRPRRSRCWPAATSTSTTPSRRPRPTRPRRKQGAGGDQAGAARPADQHPADRFGHAPLRGRPGTQRLADPGADGPAAGLHLDAVVPARSLRADPRLWHRQDQRRLLAGRGHDDRDRRATHRPADQRLHDHRLHGLREAGRRGRRRLPRHRPPLLQRERRHGGDQLLQHRSAAGLPAPERRRTPSPTCATGTPTRRTRATPASRPSCRSSSARPRTSATSPTSRTSARSAARTSSPASATRRSSSRCSSSPW